MQRNNGDRREDGSQEGANSIVTDGRGNSLKYQDLRGVKVKWRQRVEERPVHLLIANPGA